MRDDLLFSACIDFVRCVLSDASDSAQRRVMVHDMLDTVSNMYYDVCNPKENEDE